MDNIKDPENTIIMEVKGGSVVLELLPDIAPLHCERMRSLVRSGLYDNVCFHSVIEGFMAQTGDVKYGKAGGDIAFAGRGGSTLPDLPGEFSDIKFDRGIVGMARTQDPNSANSQFFIMFKPAPHLNSKYTIFGTVSSGIEVLNKIKKGDLKQNGTVKNPDFMRKVYLKIPYLLILLT